MGIWLQNARIFLTITKRRCFISYFALKNIENTFCTYWRCAEEAGAIPFIDNQAFLGLKQLYKLFPLSLSLSGHSKIDKTKGFKSFGSFMQVESIAECSPWSILQYF